MNVQPKRPRFHLGTALWALTITAVALGWMADHWQLGRELANLRQNLKELQTKNAILAEQMRLAEELNEAWERAAKDK